MSFTDEDLKRLKEYRLECGGMIWLPTDNINISQQFRINDLLARLEAAEMARRAHVNLCCCEWCESWRRAAGK